MTNALLIQLVVIVALIVVDWLATIARAIQVGQFDWDKFPKFLVTNIVPYVIVWGALAALKEYGPRVGLTGDALNVYFGFVEAIYAGIIVKMGHSILTSFSDLGIDTTPPAS